MPINLQNEQNITSGWGPAPQLHAPDLGSLVSSILKDRLLREQMTKENIAETIKNVREERQSAKYLEAMKAAGLVPQDYDAGGLGGAKLGTGLAKMIQDKREFDALETHRRAMEARPSGRGSRGGSGGGGGGGGSAEPQTVWKDGVEWRPGPGGRWIPMKPAAGTKADTPKLSPTERGWAAPSIPGLSVNINAPDEPAQVLPPDTPSMEDTTGSQAGADKNLAKGYGNDATSMSADDVRAAYRAGSMTREEAAARLRQLGLKD